MTTNGTLPGSGAAVRVEVIPEAELVTGMRVRRVLSTLPAGAVVCPLCEQHVESAALVDEVEARAFRAWSLGDEPSEGAAVTFAPCGCRWDSEEDESRMLVVSPCGKGLGFALVPVSEDAPVLLRGRGR